jgi:transcription initiation factor IIE alpha subunit
MNTDSINNEDKLSEALKKLLEGIMKSFNDPLMKVRQNSLYICKCH